MAKQGNFGPVIPKMSEIVKIEGDKVYDADGDEFTAGSIRATQLLGGEWQRVIFDEEDSKE